MYPDTGWYEKLAKEILTLNFSDYDGARTPVYPLILILGLIRWKIVWIIQMLFGVLNSLLFYLIIFKATKNKNYAFWSGLIYNLSLIFLFFESNILTETICIFFLLMTVYYFQKISEKSKQKVNGSISDYLMLSLTASLAALTRPTFTYIFPLLLLLIIYGDIKNKNIVGLFKKLVLFLIPFMILVGGWSMFNKIKVDYFGPTTLTGFHLIEHSGTFIEYAPDKYSELRDLYLKYRKIKISETGEQTTTIYMVYPEIQKNRGYSIAQISKELTAVSLWLFYHKPGLYFKSV
ncbi:MAG: glycosyltransferase family 39 protein, partial [Ignavibacteria bacterium]